MATRDILSQKYRPTVNRETLDQLGFCYTNYLLTLPIPTEAENIAAQEKLGDWFVYFKALRAGNRLERSASRNFLIENNNGLIRDVYFRHFNNNPEDYETLTKAGRLGVMRALETFNYTLGWRFSTYVRQWIYNSIRDAQRELDTYQHNHISLSTQVGEDLTFDEILLRLAPEVHYELHDPIKNILIRRAREKFGEFFSELPERDRLIIEDLQKGLSLRTVGETFSLSHEGVSQVRRRIIKKFKHRARANADLRALWEYSS